MSEPAVGSRRRRQPIRKGDLRERAILDAAEQLLTEVGADAMTVEAIATRAGITRGALYFYFGSKQEVLAALVARTIVSLSVSAQSAREDVGATPRELISSLVRNTAAAWRQHGTVMRAAVELSPAVPQIADLWTSTVEDTITSLTQLLERAGVPTGRGPSGAPALARALCWMTERNFYWASVSGSPAALKRTTEACTAVWFAVLPDDGS
jgi:AcrR family transcriptional regulator